MPTRSALVLLFALLVGVPVGAAVYFGAAGLERERSMLIEQERLTMAAIADETRDRLVRVLQQIYRAEWAKMAMPRVNDRREPIHDRFEVRGNKVYVPWREDDEELPDDIRRLLREGLMSPRGTPSPENLYFNGEFAIKLVNGAYRVFRVDVRRLAEHYLDPDSPAAVVRHAGERFEYAKLVPEDQRLSANPDRFGLDRILYRHVVPEERSEWPPALLPSKYLLEVGVRPAAALGEQLRASEEGLLWTLGGVVVVVLFGLFFAWRALRAETRLAARKAEFVSAVSHELRTPLTSIRMYADMLKEGWIKDKKAAHDYFGLISAESERLARLVNNVLDFSRIEKGAKGFEMRLGDPAPVVRDVAEVLRPYLREKGLDLVIDVPEQLPECSFDKDALKQILLNLIDNAVKYGDEEVRLEAEARDGDIVVRVLDRGPGVDAADREKIFRAFHRGRNAESVGGSGLGLALVHHYVTAHQGRIEVAERDGGGAVFAVSLPAA